MLHSIFLLFTPFFKGMPQVYGANFHETMPFSHGNGYFH